MSRLSQFSEYVYGSTTEYSYDDLGRVTCEAVKQGNVVLSQKTTAYDDAAENGLYHKVTQTVVGDTDAPSVVTTQYTDKAGNLVKTGKFLNNAEYSYDTDFALSNRFLLSSASSDRLVHISGCK